MIKTEKNASKTRKRLISMLTAMVIALSCCCTAASGVVFATERPETPVVPTAVERSVEQTVSLAQKIDIGSRKLTDNTGYRFDTGKVIESDGDHPLKKNFINMRLASDLEDVGITQEKSNYFSIEKSSGSVALEINYCDDQTQEINGTKWSLSSDTATTVNDIKTGFVGTGAIIIEKSHTGENFSSELYTADIAKSLASPKDYHGDAYKKIYNFSYEDLNKGVYLRVTFAYELKESYEVQRYQVDPYSGYRYRYIETCYNYINMLETATFYIVNNSGIIGFHNLTNDIEKLKEFVLDKTVSSVAVSEKDTPKDAFQTALEAKIKDGTATSAEKMDYINSFEPDREKHLTDASVTELAHLYRNGETLQSGDMTATGFSIDTYNGDLARISCKYNQKSRIDIKYNGQIFSKPGRYDFTVKMATGKTKSYTIYVNPKSKNATKNDYFDTDFITQGSKRVYSVDAQYPVFEKGGIDFKIKAVQNQTPLSGYIARISEVKDAEGNTQQDVTILQSYLSTTCEGTKKRIDTQQNFGTVIYYDPAVGLSGKLDLEAGSYAAVFYTNEDFRDEVTGDYYTFTYLFNVVREGDTTGPVVNQAYLNGMASIANFASKYYGVELQGKNGHTVTYAFAYYERAYNFAYNYELSVSRYEGGSQYDFLKGVHLRAEKRVKEKYFDASDEDTYLTVGSQKGMGDFITGSGEVDLGSDVLNMNLTRDVVVFSASSEIQYLRTALPFLNNGKLAYIDENGVVERKKTDFRFISVADYDSFSVVLQNTESKKEYPVAYGLSVEAQLKAQQAPSGKYKVIETAKFGDGSVKTSSYYAVYLAEENTAEINAVTRTGGAAQAVKFSREQDGQTFHVNSFVMRGVVNELDRYSILKITGNGKKQIFSIWEVENLCLDTNGSYLVEVVDRLGNEFGFTVVVENAVKAAIVSFDSAGGRAEQDLVAFVGDAAELPQPQKEAFTFAGWQAEDGTVYHTSFVPVLAGKQTLTALWNHEKTQITVVDGDMRHTYTVFPGAKFALPNLSRDGFALFGFFYENESGNKVYLHEISSVPNVAEMQLTVLWKKSGQPPVPPDGGETQVVLADGGVSEVLPAEGGRVLLPDRTAAGMEFLGWMRIKGLEGVIYRGEINDLPSGETVTLVAVYRTAVTDSSAGNADAAATIAPNRFAAIWNDLLSAACMLFVVFFALWFLKRQRANCGLAVWGQTAHMTSGSAAAARQKMPWKAKFKPVFQGGASRMTILKRQGESRSVYRAPNAERSKPAWFVSVCFALIALFVLNPLLVKCIGAKYVIPSVTQAAAAQEGGANVFSSDTAKGMRGGAYSPEQIDKQTASLGQSNYPMTEEDAFLYSVEMLDLASDGYTVFPASVIADGDPVYGLAYSRAEEFFERSGEKDAVYVAVGFTAFAGQKRITDAMTERGMVVKPLDGAVESGEVKIKYLLTFEESAKDQADGMVFYKHYVANGKYVRYAVYDLAFHIVERVDYDKNRTDYGCGKLYSYDEGCVVYDPTVGTGGGDFSLLAESIFQDLSSQQAEMFFTSFLKMQDENYLTTELQSQVYVSEANLGEYLLSRQSELFLGISAEEKRQLQKEAEGLFDDGIYYYLYEDGNKVIQLDYSIDDSKQPKPNWALVAVGAVVIVAGAALCFVCPPAGAGAVAAGTALVSAATVTTIILGALAFGLIAAGTNLMLQGFAGTDWQDIDWASFAVETAVGAVTGALGRLFTAAVSTGKIAGTAAKILAGVKYGVSVLLQSFGAYASVMISTGNSEEAWKAFGFAFVISLAVGSLELIGDLKAVNKVGQSGGVIENKVDDYMRTVDEAGHIKFTAGDGEQTVYIARDLKSGKPYIGRTKQDVNVRISQHGYKGKPKELIAYMDGLNYDQVRGLEQGLIDLGEGIKGEMIANIRNGVAKSNISYDLYMAEGRKFVDLLGDILLNIING